MKNINDYKKRFYNLMESTIGDVRPLLNEANLPSLWIGTTTALQGIATTYNNALDASIYKKDPNRSKIYFSVERTHITNGQGLDDVAWRPKFGNTYLTTDKLPSWYIIDQTNVVAKPDIAKKISEYIATPISRKYGSKGSVPTVSVIGPIDTAVAAINAAIKKDKNTTRP